MRFLSRVTICGNLTGKVARIKEEKERKKKKKKRGEQREKRRNAGRDATLKFARVGRALFLREFNENRN